MSITQPTETSHRRRHQRPASTVACRFPGGARFSDSSQLQDPVFIVRTLKAYPHIAEPLLAATTPTYKGGRRRMEGSWALVMVAFLMSGIVEYRTFRDRWASSGLWQEAGFDAGYAPGPSLTHLRLTELEHYWEAFEEAAQKLIRQARRHEPRIGVNVHLDGSAFTTNAVPRHACPDREDCRKRRLRAPAELQRASQEAVDAARHAASSEPEEAAESAHHSITWLSLDDERLASVDRDERARYRWFVQNGHVFRVLDRSVGARAYMTAGKRRTTRKFHFGGHNLMASDDLFHAPLAVHCQTADRPEATDYPLILEKVCQALGETPVTMTVDRGFHFRAVFEENLKRRVSTVCEWRQPHAGLWPVRLECEKFDRDGVVRCQHCGDTTHSDAPGLGLFLDQRGNPYLRVRCQGRHTPDCIKPQRVRCDLEPRLLQPINRTTKLFWDLIESHKNKEALFLHNRQRYGIAGNDFSERPKRRQVVAVQQLRAACGMFIDWFRICLMHDFLASPKKKRRELEGITERQSGRGHWRTRLAARESEGLHLPYGRAAFKLGLAPDPDIPGQRAGP